MSLDLWLLLCIAVLALVRIWIERRRERIEWLAKHRSGDYA